MTSAELGTGCVHAHTHLYLLIIHLQLHQKALNPWDAHSHSLFLFSATLLFPSLCHSVAAAGLLLCPTKDNGGAAGDGDDDEGG